MKCKGTIRKTQEQAEMYDPQDWDVEGIVHAECGLARGRKLS